MTKLWITRISAGVVCAVLVWFFASARVAVPVAAAGSCEGLMSLKLPSTTITSAKVAPATLPDTKIRTWPKLLVAPYLFLNRAASRQR